MACQTVRIFSCIIIISYSDTSLLNSIFEFKDVPGSHGLWSIYSVIHALMWTFFFVLLISMIEFQMRWSPGANPAKTNF